MPQGRRTLDRAQVLAGAVELADAHGLARLTMRRLGDALGVEAMSLYNHVANKDQLLDAMAEAVAAEVVLAPDGVGWREATRRRAVDTHTALMAHPWAPLLWASRISLGPARMASMDAQLRWLTAAGFAPDLLDQAFHAVENHILGSSLQEASFPADDPALAAIGQRFMATAATDFPHLADHIRHHMDHGLGDGTEFTFALDLLLDGIESMWRATHQGAAGHA